MFRCGGTVGVATAIPLTGRRSASRGRGWGVGHGRSPPGDGHAGRFREPRAGSTSRRTGDSPRRSEAHYTGGHGTARCALQRRLAPGGHGVAPHARRSRVPAAAVTVNLFDGGRGADPDGEGDRRGTIVRFDFAPKGRFAIDTATVRAAKHADIQDRGPFTTVYLPRFSIYPQTIPTIRTARAAACVFCWWRTMRRWPKACPAP